MMVLTWALGVIASSLLDSLSPAVPLVDVESPFGNAAPAPRLVNFPLVELAVCRRAGGPLGPLRPKSAAISILKCILMHENQDSQLRDAFLRFDKNMMLLLSQTLYPDWRTAGCTR